MELKLTTKEFLEALRQDKLLGLRCRACGAVHTPPAAICPECDSLDMDIVELSGRGKIRTYTVIWTAPEGFQPPYIVSLVELDEGPWLMGNILGVDPNTADMSLIGRRVKLGHRVLPGDRYSAGEKVAITFATED
ncbi:MAG TPA: Zn-ribbon domain-containing OB-fold protein [Dehalococcoidia bacterium]|jgi:hypothetical protein|nr:Zn-ribbon domain-containing OB-fold protein [Dehalococcoidia bacterium]